METLFKMTMQNNRNTKISTSSSEHHKGNVLTISNHGSIMLLAHIVPIGLIIVLPLLGFTGSWTFIVPLILMVGIHIWMMKNHLIEYRKDVHKI